MSRRVSVREAARLLDVSESAIHKRVQRGTLEHDKDADGRVFIYLDDVTDSMSDTVQHPSTNALISEMQSRIESLEQQLEHEREANRENRRLLAAALERIPAIEASIHRIAAKAYSRKPPIAPVLWDMPLLDRGPAS